MEKVIEIRNGNYPDFVVEKITGSIISGKIIIMPSDTIYGFLALPELEGKLRLIKKRDKKPFLYLINSLNDLKKINIESGKYTAMLNKYWPGPVTFILMNNKNETVGVRMPDFKELRKIIKKSNSPLISTSVNYSGMPVINDIDEIIDEFKNNVNLIIKDNKFRNGLASTIADLSSKPYKIIRQGSMKIDEI